MEKARCHGGLSAHLGNSLGGVGEAARAAGAARMRQHPRSRQRRRRPYASGWGGGRGNGDSCQVGASLPTGEGAGWGDLGA